MPSIRGEARYSMHIFTVSRYKCVFRVIEIVEESLVERDSCTENRGEYNLCRYHLAFCHGQGCECVDRVIIEGFADFIGHYFTYPFKVSAETQHVFLDIYIAQLCHVLAD